MTCHFKALKSLFYKLILTCGLLLMTTNSWSAGSDSAQSKQTTINGAIFNYQEQGDGAPVVFVHGCCSDYRAWDGQRKAIASKYRFVAFNLRYHGTSPWFDGGSKYSIATHVDDVAAFIQSLNSGPVSLVGWSYSGPIVMLVALQHPELVRSIAVYEPNAGGFITDPEILKSAGQDRQAMLGPAVAASKSGDLANVARLVPAGVNSQLDIFDHLPPEARSMFLDNARTVALLVASPPPPPLSCDQLRQITIPTLLSRGEDTRAVFRLATDGAAACIANAKVVVLPGGRHLSMVQQPDAFNAMLMQFLSTVGSQVKN